jgi:hypothetical protein
VVKKTIKKIKEWWGDLVIADIGLAQVKKFFNKWENPHRKTDKEHKREVMDRMDRDNKKDGTGADYRGYRGGWQIVTRVAHYLRKVSALIDDNMFLMGMGVDGCGNMLTFLIDPNRGGRFTDANYNADAIIWRIINNQNLNVDRLPLDNLIALYAALNREIQDAMGHQLIRDRLINRRNDIAERIAVLEREREALRAARTAAPAAEQPLAAHGAAPLPAARSNFLCFLIRNRQAARAAAEQPTNLETLELVRNLHFNDLGSLINIHDGINVLNGEERDALIQRINEVMTDHTIDIGRRRIRSRDLRRMGLENVIEP